jgi:ribosomal protein S18 acetylase RimI-like enzyme
MALQYVICREIADTLPFLDAIRTQADSEREALGFLPAPAYAEAIKQRKLIALVADQDGRLAYAGHLLFGGIFPHLRVRQICIAPSHRRHGNATLLLRALKAQGEAEGYLSIVANVASDLTAANLFYERNGFATQRLKSGGVTRNRTINVKTLQLESPSLIDLMSKPAAVTAIHFVQPKKRAADAPLYAIDLNVFFDVVRQRARAVEAGAVFEAGLRHQIRVTATEELVRELERKSTDRANDPILALARSIPTLPVQDQAIIDELRPVITRCVFPDVAPTALSSTDKSDVLHLCHAVVAGAAGYVTSDEKVLRARDKLMSQFGLDVIGLSEFVELLESPTETPTKSAKATRNFHISSANTPDIMELARSENVAPEAFLEVSITKSLRVSVSDSAGLIGVGLLSPAPSLSHPSRSVVCVRQDHPYSSTVADFIISDQLRTCSRTSGCMVSLLDIGHHPITRRVASSHGFQPSKNDRSSLIKVALGRPVTKISWNAARLTTERIGGFKIQESCPTYSDPMAQITLADGQQARLPLFELETLLSPTLLALPRRNAVIVPITAEFANALLGTEEQLSFLDVPEAQFLSHRTYFNTPRAANVMIRGSAIAFYESARAGGRGAIVAIARIVDVTAAIKDFIPEFMHRAAVVEDVTNLTKSEKVLVTTFDNLMPLKTSVSLSVLRKIGCVPGSNFVSATRISVPHLEQILLTGFPDE